MMTSLSVTFKAATLILLSTAISGNLPEDDFRIINKQDLLASDSSVFEDKSSRSFSQLLFEVAREQVIVGARNQVVEPADQILMALQFYASGSFYRCVGDTSGLHKSTICRIVHRVSCALARRRLSFIKMPGSEAELLEVAQKFYEIARFPKTLGALDCTHIPIVSPGGAYAEDHRNRKGYFSINVQVVSDADLCIRNIVARWPGAAHDVHIFNSSTLKTRLETDEFNQYWLVADKGYSVKPYLMIPLNSPLTQAEILYNESQIRTRNVVERLFGLWKRRFPAIGTKLRVKMHTIQPVIIATAVIHNICRRWNIPQPPDFVQIRDEIEAEEVPYASTEDDVNRNTLVQGYFASDAIYRLSLRGLRLIEKADWAAPPDKAQLCQDKGQTEEDCHNFIKILLSYGHKLFVCGTNAFKPLCSWREIESIKSVLEWVTGVEKCFPYNPHSNVTSILTTTGAYYTGTSTDFSGSDTAICGDRNVSFSGIGTIRTSQYDYKWLYEPQFVGSFEDDNFVYFVFREIALEHVNCGKKIYSRIARICKNDSGGNSMIKNNWNTFLKARLNCSVPGEYPFYYDEVQSVEYLPDRKILAAVFTTSENSITGSAVCFYNMSEVHKAFEGPFKIQEEPTRTWEPKVVPKQVKEHFRCGASLSSHQLIEYHQHHLMNDAVQPISAQPIYTTILEKFTHVTVDITQTKRGDQYVVFVATKDSNILKLAVLPEFKGVCLVEIWKLKDYKSQVRVLSLQFVKDTMSVYIGSETGVIRLIAYRCQRHRSRASCLGATDPYCGWDDGRDLCLDAPSHVNEARFVQSSDRCPTIDMPVNGGWSSWSEWEPCVQDNGPGYNGYNEKPDMCMCRHRKCDNPKPANGGENCEGASTAVSNCTVHGGWSPWSPWSECSATCGIALKSRRRSCTAPEPKYGGRVCVGQDSHELYCTNLPPCPDPTLLPVDGGWSQWGPWTACTSEGGPICGPNAGWRERRRTCNNPVPKYGGADCDGIKIEKQICDLRPCEVKRVTAWTPWVQIPSNSSDGGYTEKRFKFACKAPSPEQIKVKDEERYCTSQGYCGPAPPPEADGWSEWGEWGACSAACGGGQQTRRRDCLRPPCRGQSTTLRACNTHNCRGEWSCWSDWSECSGDCNDDGTSATGHRTRTRMCLSPEGCDDAGAALERRVCVNTCDDPDTGWSDWGEWGPCIGEERVRKRTCIRGACIGPLVQVALCEDEIDNSLNALPAYSQGVETASFVTLRDNHSMSLGAVIGCVVTAFVMGFFVCFVGFIYCSRRKNSRLPWRRKTKVPSSPHYITAKQNSYVTVPLKDVPRKAKRQPSFTGISSSTSGIILSKSNNLSTNPNNHNNAVTTPKLYPKAIANEYDNMGTLRRHSNQPNHKSNINLEEEKFY